MMLQNLIATFQNVFETSEHPRCFFAPGRINLIGEHTDYNGGYVFPAAISLGTYALATKRSDEKVRLYSTNFAETGIIECSLEQLDYLKSDEIGIASCREISYNNLVDVSEECSTSSKH